MPVHSAFFKLNSSRVFSQVHILLMSQTHASSPIEISIGVKPAVFVSAISTIMPFMKVQT